MKLSELRSSIRNMKGNPHVIVELTRGLPMTLHLQKTPLLEELGRAYDNDRNAETGLHFNETTGLLSSVTIDDCPDLEEAMAPVQDKSAIPFYEGDDEDDDLL